MSTEVPAQGEREPIWYEDSPTESFDCIPGTPIQYPSKAYKSSCDSYTYRLSELIFGSLLASYILGFVSFAAKSPLAQILQSLFISVTFCYLTAAYYVTYHNSILTMPHIPNRGLRFDFLIAIFQAVLFGISMLWPKAFLVCLAASLMGVYLRQSIAFAQLGKLFEETSSPRKGKVEASMGFFFRPKFKEAVEAHNHAYGNCMDGWMPIEGKQWAIAIVLLLIGGLFTWGDLIVPALKDPLRMAWLKTSSEKEWMQAVLYGIMFLLVLNSANNVFKERANHKYGYTRIPIATPGDGERAVTHPNFKREFLLDLAANAVVQELKEPAQK